MGISFIQSIQDAKISLERLNEIHSQPDEDTDLDDKVSELPEDRTIRVEHVTFSYDGAERNYALNDVSLEIPERKVTAIVGESGCGSASPEHRKECRPDIGNAAWSNSGVWNSSGAAGKEGLLLRVGEESIIDGVKRRLISCNYSARNP